MGFLDKLIPWLPVVGDIYSAEKSSSAARQANKTNIMLSREQRAWEQEMANTAVQRRKSDIEKAGFNPLLAAMGPGAGTPSVSAPTVEPTYRDNLKGTGTQAMLAAAQFKNINADTAAKTADARSKNVQAAIDEKFGLKEHEFIYGKHINEEEIGDLRIQIMRSLVPKTAAESKVATETIDSLVETMRNQAEKGRLDLKQLRDVIDTLGLGAEQKANILQKLMNILSPLLKD